MLSKIGRRLFPKLAEIEDESRMTKAEVEECIGLIKAFYEFSPDYEDAQAAWNRACWAIRKLSEDILPEEDD